MPRRPPPSALLLHTGPTPPRTQPKHSLPSFPCPSFYPAKAPRAASPDAYAGWSAPPSSNSSPSPTSRKAVSVRGPWDHSRSLSESTLDVDSLIRMPQPAAVTVSPLLSSVW